MSQQIRKLKRVPVYSLILLWVFYFTVGFTFHYHPTYNHAHAGQLQPHDHPGHFHSQEVERIAAAIHPGFSPLLPGETHHHSESIPGDDSETLQLEFNKSSLPSIQPKCASNAAVIQVFHQEHGHGVHHTLVPTPPSKRARHLPPSLSVRAPPGFLS